jgi:hypothetical protein
MRAEPRRLRRLAHRDHESNQNLPTLERDPRHECLVVPDDPDSERLAAPLSMDGPGRVEAGGGEAAA